MTTRRLTAALACAGIVAATVLAVPGTAAADEPKCPKAGEKVSAKELKKDTLWGQRLLDVERVWSKTKGEGVKVAVIDSGVDKTHSLLEGRVSGSGKAFIHNTENKKPKGGDNATEDCDGHGTEVAGIIAGSKDKKTGFHGIAPKAEIVPYRISNTRPGEEDQATEEDGEENDDIIVTTDKFAEAINAAVDAKVDVINLSVKYGEDYDNIRGAVENAVDAGVVVVAAAGNGAGTDKKPTDTYPANYEGVIGVGAVDSNVSKVASSQSGPWVDVVAPGENVAAPLPGGDYEPVFGGTSAAAAFVSGTAALLKAQHPEWKNEEISEQIFATASPTPGGTGMYGDENVEGETGMSPDYGHGLVDPYMAVSETLNPGERLEKTQMAAPEADPAAVERNAGMAKMRSWALWIGLGSIGLFVAALAGVGALRRGKKTGWHVKKVDSKEHIEHFDDGDPIPMFHGIKGLKE